MASPQSGEQKERECISKELMVPTHYFVSLTPDLVKQFKFLGRVEIDFRVKKESDSVVLNSAELTILSVDVSQGDSSESIKTGDLKYDEKKEELTIPLKNKLTKGDAKVSIEYVGILNDQMKGFYKSKYKRSNGSDAFCGVTQFEATDARRAFPCVDEPAAKAAFTVELTVPADLQAISNMPESKVDLQGNVKTVLFEKTPIMSTYLLAWFVGEFGFTESKTNRGVIVRVWTSKGREKEGVFACDTACKCLDFYEKYFSIEYPLPKCDMVAVPDFAAGAMENWGLITYRELALLADSETASLRQKRYIAIVVCHELAHQWFGNLVTMDWWSQLWLNEGFACFMEYLSSDAIFPEWPMWNMFIVSEFSRAFELDGMATSHPIEVDVRTASEAEEVFDAISYCKGASVIRMLQSFLGDSVFQSALSKYLNNFRYSNAVTTDLWDFLSKESGKPVASIMATWTREQGFPVVSAVRNGDKVTLTQSRYLSSGAKLSKEQERVVWNVPMYVRTNKGTNRILFENKSQTIDLDPDTKWIHLNADSTGFFCANYGKRMLTDLLSNTNDLTTLDKVCLLRDSTALAQSGVPGATQSLLNLLIAFKDDRTHPVWDAVLSAASEISHVIDHGKDISDDFNSVMRNVLAGIYKSVGWECKADEDEEVRALIRPLVISHMCKYQDESVIKVARAKLKEFFAAEGDKEKQRQILDPSLRSSVYAIGVKYGGKEEFNKMREYYLNVTDSGETQWALRALGYTQDKDLIVELCDYLLKSEEVKPQDKVFPMRVVAGTRAGREYAWEFLQKTWSEWEKIYKGGFLLQHVAKLPSNFVTFRRAEEVEKFYSGIDQPKCKRSMQQAVENIRKYAKWQQRDLEVIKRWTGQQAKKISS